jgi:hypothetical protein
MSESQIPRVESESSSQRNTSAEQYQPDHLDDVTLPRFGLVFFNHLIGEYDSFTCRADLNRDAFNKISHLKEIYLGNTRPLTWGDLAALECLTLQLRTGQELRERFWALQMRYREAAPKEFVQDEMIVAERASIKTMPDDELRARAEVIAWEFFRLCILAICREAMRSTASRRTWFAMLAFVGFYILGLFLWISMDHRRFHLSFLRERWGDLSARSAEFRASRVTASPLSG